MTRLLTGSLPLGTGPATRPLRGIALDLDATARTLARQAAKAHDLRLRTRSLSRADVLLSDVFDLLAAEDAEVAASAARLARTASWIEEAARRDSGAEA